jgi:hypothetical protein
MSAARILAQYCAAIAGVAAALAFLGVWNEKIVPLHPYTCHPWHTYGLLACALCFCFGPVAAELFLVRCSHLGRAAMLCCLMATLVLASVNWTNVVTCAPL